MKVASFEKWGEWIDPWRDRRPMTADDVLVTSIRIRGGDIDVNVHVSWYRSDEGKFFNECFNVGDGWRVLAWMPLPEAFSPDEEEEKQIISARDYRREVRTILNEWLRCSMSVDELRRIAAVRRELDRKTDGETDED